MQNFHTSNVLNSGGFCCLFPRRNTPHNIHPSSISYIIILLNHVPSQIYRYTVGINSWDLGRCYCNDRYMHDRHIPYTWLLLFAHQLNSNHVTKHVNERITFNYSYCRMRISQIGMKANCVWRGHMISSASIRIDTNEINGIWCSNGISVYATRLIACLRVGRKHETTKRELRVANSAFQSSSLCYITWSNGRRRKYN